MKRATLLSIAILSMLLTACKKEGKNEDNNYYMTALKNDIAWSASPSWNFLPLNKPDTMEIRGYNSQGLLYIRLIRKNQGEYQIDNTQTGYELRTTTGANLATYMLSAGSANAVRLTTIDTIKHYMAGSFDLNFTKLTGNSDAPAVFTFKNGDFKAGQILGFTL